MIDQAKKVLGYQFKDESLLTEALTHASSASERVNSNERMEFMGDAILGFVICEYLYATFPDLLEGEMTKIKSVVVSRRTCAQISHQINLAQMLTLGKGMVTRPGMPSSVAAAVFESIIAAIYLDGGMEPARSFILTHMTPSIQEAANSAHQQNFKSVLQQHAQKHLSTAPQYLVLDEKGPDHAKVFEVAVEVDTQRFGSAWANSKKEAEQKAALLALSGLGLAQLDEQGHVQLCPAPASNPASDLS